MKAVFEFSLPEESKEYRDCYKGSDYINAIREIVEVLGNHIKYTDNEDDGIYSVADAFEKMYERVFWICKEHGFSPWDD